MDTNKNDRHGDQQLPQKVHNAAQDPNSMRDPLQQQLERSEGLNGEKERQTLEQLRRQYGSEGDGASK